MTTQSAHYYRGPAASTAESIYNVITQSKDNTITITDLDTMARVLNSLFFSVEQLNQLKDFYAATIANLKTIHICNHCGDSYSLWRSVGLRGCKAHLGRLTQGEWQCCKSTQFDSSLKPFVQPRARKALFPKKRANYLLPKSLGENQRCVFYYNF